jgi:hypothetical protein
MLNVKPVQVPWWISPSTPYLDLELQGEAFEATIRFLGSYGPLAVDPKKGGDRRLRVTFTSAVRTRSEPLQDDADKSSFPFFNLGGVPFSPSEPERYLIDLDRQWSETGICPDPRMYESEPDASGVRTFIVRGHDVTLFVDASAWSWTDDGEAVWILPETQA